MRRVFQLLGLSGLVMTGLVSAQARAEEPGNADEQPAVEAPKAAEPVQPPPAPTPAAPAPAAEVAAPAADAAQSDQLRLGQITAHGYFRAGFGANIDQKGRQTCFGLLSINGGLKAKYRLGNECEQWGELELTTVVYKGDDGVVGRFHFMPVVYIPTTYGGYSPFMSITAQDQQMTLTQPFTVAFPNLYADLTGIDWLYGGKAWAGARYYKRESVYINDFFYWNPSGIGGGIEDAFQIGKIWADAPDSIKDVSFSYGAFALDGQPTGDNYLPQQFELGVRNDFQIRGFKPYAGSELQLGFEYIKDWSASTDGNGGAITTYGGWGVTLQHIQQLLGGENKLVFQYGRGGGTGFGTLARFWYPDFSLSQDTSEWRFRFIELFTIQPVSWFGTQGVFVYQHDHLNGPSAGDWYSAGDRVSIGLLDHLKLLGEIGHDETRPTNGSDKRMLTKLSAALAIAGAKGFWGRPELRLYYTWAVWNANARTAHVDTGDVYLNTNKLSGSIAGLQAEAMF